MNKNFVKDFEFTNGLIAGNKIIHSIGHDKITNDTIIIYL
jgi:hypothetical protein